MTVKGLASALGFVYKIVTKTALFVASLLFLAIVVRDCRSVEEKKIPAKGYDQEPDLNPKAVRK